jgi:hypothetical protein
MQSQFTDRMVLVNIKVIEWNHNLQTGWYWSISRLWNEITIYRQDGTSQYEGYRMELQFTDRMVLVNIKVIE